MATKRRVKREWYTIPEVRRLLRRRGLRVSEQKLRRLADSGLIQYRRLPGRGSWRRLYWPNVMEVARCYAD